MINVLYVDDCHSSAQIRADVLGEHFDVTTAATAADGIEKLSQQDVDCVLSDLEMPGQDGLEFLEEVRETHPHLPFILFTRKESEDTITAAFEEGVTDFVPKSFCAISYELLIRRIEQAVLLSRTRKQLVYTGLLLDRAYAEREDEPSEVPAIGSWLDSKPSR